LVLLRRLNFILDYINNMNWLLNLFTHKRPTNTGIILEPLKPEDYVAGVSSPIVYNTRLKDGNWTPYAWDTENQYSSKGDALDCVTESFINSIEAQEYFITGKKVNYSKRWIAKISGTNQGIYKGLGNTYGNVAEAIRKNGLVLESSYPKPVGDWTADEFYKDINPDLQTKLLAEGQIWLTKWNYQYEYLQVTDPNLDFHLKHCPINVVIPGHSICGIYSPADLMNYLDSYPNYFKTTPVSNLQAAMKGILTPKTIEANVFAFQNSPELWVGIRLDSMQRLDFIKQNLPVWLPDYYLNEKVIVLPTKKPL